LTNISETLKLGQRWLVRWVTPRRPTSTDEMGPQGGRRGGRPPKLFGPASVRRAHGRSIRRGARAVCRRGPGPRRSRCGAVAHPERWCGTGAGRRRRPTRPQGNRQRRTRPPDPGDRRLRRRRDRKAPIVPPVEAAAGRGGRDRARRLVAADPEQSHAAAARPELDLRLAGVDRPGRGEVPMVGDAAVAVLRRRRPSTTASSSACGSLAPSLIRSRRARLQRGRVRARTATSSRSAGRPSGRNTASAPSNSNSSASRAPSALRAPRAGRAAPRTPGVVLNDAGVARGRHQDGGSRVRSRSPGSANGLAKVGSAPASCDSVALRWRCNRGTIGRRDERKMKGCEPGGAAIRGGGR